ncbi:uncharacterized protein LOC131938095 [Physella acuta]|uniref:uncharacterized protein LOC131938095 n=1 Tax=Physella acuta TaxID=109671 RepID=UPI0027DE0E6D|nr:uncharacterized protein LOC131938095 [Physella acuta]
MLQHKFWVFVSTSLLGLLVGPSHAAVIRSRRDGTQSLHLSLSDLHSDIYTGSNKEDGDGNHGNMIDIQSPDPAPVPDIKPPAATEPDPVQSPDPPKVDPPKVDPPKVDPPKVDPPKVDPPGPDNSNKEDGDGDGNNGGVDTPSAPAAQEQQQQVEQQQQQQQEEQQQQQQQQPEAVPTEPPPAAPETTEPLPVDTANEKSHAADHAHSPDSSEEVPLENMVDPSSINIGAPDGVGGGAGGSPDPFDVPPGDLGHQTPKYNDPFDPFIHPNNPPPPPPPIHFLMPIRPPPPPPPMKGNVFPPPHPVQILHPPHPHILPPELIAPPPPPPVKSDRTSTNEKSGFKAEADALALDRQNDLLDLKQDQLNNTPAKDTPTPALAPPIPTQMSMNDMKGLAADKAADALDLHRDMVAMAKEKEAAAKEVASNSGPAGFIFAG